MSRKAIGYLVAIIVALAPVVVAYKDTIEKLIDRLFPPQPQPSLENGKSYLEYSVPPGIGISRYTVHRDRAEYSYVELWVFNRGLNDYVYDNTAEREEKKDVEVPQPLKNPQAFQANPRGFQIKITGNWMPDNSNHNKFGKIEGRQGVQSYAFFMYAKQSDPSPTMIAVVYFDKKIPGM